MCAIRHHCLVRLTGIRSYTPNPNDFVERFNVLRQWLETQYIVALIDGSQLTVKFATSHPLPPKKQSHNQKYI